MLEGMGEGAYVVEGAGDGAYVVERPPSGRSPISPGLETEIPGCLTGSSSGLAGTGYE